MKWAINLLSLCERASMAPQRKRSIAHSDASSSNSAAMRYNSAEAALDHERIINNIATKLASANNIEFEELTRTITTLASAMRIKLRDRDCGVICALQAMHLLERMNAQDLTMLPLKHWFLAAFIIANKTLEEHDRSIAHRFWAKTTDGELANEDLLELELKLCSAIKWDLRLMNEHEFKAHF